MKQSATKVYQIVVVVSGTVCLITVATVVTCATPVKTMHTVSGAAEAFGAK